MSQSEEIKNKLDIVDVLRDYIQLKPAGANFRALCPFHGEKTPSFMVSPEKQIFHCFGCGKGGDVFSFVMDMEGLDFSGVLRLLAPKAGVVLKRQDFVKSSQRSRLLDLLDLASRYYHKSLLDTSGGKKMLEYLKDRNLSDDTIAEWQIGYSQNSWDDLINFLKNKKYREDEISKVGLSHKKEGKSHYYNRFRNRIMFPIKDINGNTVAFTARVNPQIEEQEKMGKYINSPETELYNKSKILFGLDKAKMEIKKQDLAIVVEGQMDVIACHQAGFTNVVASSGTALTNDQLKILKRYSNNIALSFDMDKAGQMAADRGINEALGLEMNIRVIVLPEGKDPADLIAKSSQSFRDAVEQSVVFMEYCFDKVLEEHDVNEVVGKKHAAKKIMDLISKIVNKIEQDHWMKQASEKLNVSENVFRESLTSLKSLAADKEKKNVTPATPVKAVLSREEKLAKSVLALLLKFPQLIPYAISNLEVKEVSGDKNVEFYNQLIIYYNKDNSLDYSQFSNWLKESSREVFSLLSELTLLGEKDFYNLESSQAQKELINLISLAKSLFRQSRKKDIEKEIAVLEKAGKRDEVTKLLEELQRLSAQN